MKKKPIDLDNFGHESKGVPKGLKTDSEFRARNRAQEPVNQAYDPKEMVTKTLSSTLDKPVTVTVQQEEKPQASTFNVPGRETKAIK